ncbi:hypothetical protein [Caldimonas taiwanensis]|uniref:hypothetical protein n=1 Tax=Caldimonas taiwanensis TaxID=307483 RepID=UPI000A86386D|nr:hypothetical protein [Caldimonas taiwanensis]
MPTPNYAYEKRQRELAKKRKKEEKLKRKAEQRAHHGPAPEADPSAAAPGQRPAAPQD